MVVNKKVKDDSQISCQLSLLCIAELDGPSRHKSYIPDCTDHTTFQSVQDL